MKKLLAVWAVVALMAIGFLAMAMAEMLKFTIIGYGREQYAVVADIERQANEMIKDWGVKKPVKIIIWGFADKAGKMAENEKYASMRANEMKAFLETKTDAKITALSRGDSENERKVVISVEFAAVSAPEPIVKPQLDRRPESYFLTGVKVAEIFVTIIILSLAFLLFRRPNQQVVVSQLQPQPQELIEPTNTVKSTEAATETKWVKVDGYSVRIEIDYVDGEKRYYSPFTHASGLKIYEPSESRMISSLRRCLKPDSKLFSEQAKSLQEEGVIRPAVL